MGKKAKRRNCKILFSDNMIICIEIRESINKLDKKKQVFLFKREISILATKLVLKINSIPI